MKGTKESMSLSRHEGSTKSEHVPLICLPDLLFVLLSVLQAHLLALPLSGQQHQGLRLRPLLSPHTGNAGHQPVLRLLIGRTRGDFRR